MKKKIELEGKLGRIDTLINEYNDNIQDSNLNKETIKELFIKKIIKIIKK